MITKRLQRNSEPHLKSLNWVISLSPVFLLFLFFTIFSSACYAQGQNQITLTSQTLTHSISPYVYVTLDPDKKLTPQTLADNFRHDLRGDKMRSDIVFPGLGNPAFWMVFEVVNQSDLEEWYLHFGDINDGRMGMVKDIYVGNMTTMQTFVSSKAFPSWGKNNTNNNLETEFFGPALAIHLKPSASNLIVVFLDTGRGFPNSFAPKIIAEQTYISTLLTGDVFSVLAGLFFVAMMAFFTFLLFISKKIVHIFYLAYYGLLCALFFILNQTLLSGLILNSSFICLIYASSFICAVIITKISLRLEKSDHPVETFMLIGLTLVCFASFIALIWIPGIDSSGILIFLASCMTLILGVSLITLFIGRESAQTSRPLCLGWGCHMVGLVCLTLSIYGLISLSSFFINIFWLSFVPQAGFFILSHLRELKSSEERQKQETLRQRHEAQILARLQKSKESADQARLLRVIERERELMSELREREIQRTEEMRFAKDAADRANQAKSAFLAVVSHEIRTPMTGIMGMVQLLEDTNLNKTQGDYVDTIKKSGQSMMTLLNDILDFEKIERGSMDIENVPFDLTRLAQDVVTLMTGHAAQKGLYLKLELDENLPHFVSGDPTRLRQVLLNLVNNGLKFTQEGGVTIKISSKKSEETEEINSASSLICFSVIDSGIGISKGALSKLFTPFTQAETSTSRKYGGTGLGLAISDRLIMAMGSKIKVQSEVGKGSCFWFEILMLEHQNQDSKSIDVANTRDKFKSRPLRILVVEDNEMNRKVLHGLLSKDGHQVSQASNGLEALELCRREIPELILMDIQMQGMSGLETVKALRADNNQAVARIPVIALTGNVMLEDIEAFYHAQMNGFIAKPIDAAKLNETIYNASIGRFDNPLPKDKNDISEYAKASPDTGLELDSREHFVSDSEIDSQKKIRGRYTPVPMTFDSDNTDQTPSSQKNLSISNDDEFIFPGHSEQEEDATEENDESEALTKKRKNDISFKKDDELTEIQKFLLSQHSLSNKPSTKVALESSSEDAKAPPLLKQLSEKKDTIMVAPPVTTQNHPSSTHDISPKAPGGPILDEIMLKGLIDALGKDKFSSLLEGFLSKADEIIELIDFTVQNSDLSALSARSHELKGMAANFGMKEVSRLAAESEKASKTANSSQAFENAKQLKNAAKLTHNALKEWLEKN